MKKVLVIILALILVYPFPTTHAATDIVNDATLSTSLSACWSLDETSGDRVDDVNSYSMTDNNTVSSETGIQGNAATFVNTNSEHLNYTSPVSDFVWDGTTDRSFSLWFNVDNTSGVKTIFSKWDNPTSASEVNWILYLNGSTLNLLTAGGLGVAKTSIAANTTYHVIVTLADASNTGELFVNNVSAGTDVSTSPVTGTGNSDVAIGYNTNTNYYSGWVDEVAWWTKVLSSGERASLYNSGSGIPCVSAGGGGGEPTPVFHPHGLF